MTFDLILNKEPEVHIWFSRDSLTGAAKAMVNRVSTPLANALNPFTHFSMKLTKAYKFSRADGGEIIILKKRPLWMAGLRPQTFTVFFNGTQKAEYSGY